MKNRVRRSGFTLPEVLVTVTVVAVMAAVVVPAVTQFAGKGDAPTLSSNLGAIRTSVTTYASANHGAMPTKLSDLAQYTSGITVTGTPGPTATVSIPGYGDLVVADTINTVDVQTNGVGYLTLGVTSSSVKCTDLESTIDDKHSDTGLFRWSAAADSATNNVSPCATGKILLVPRGS